MCSPSDLTREPVWRGVAQRLGQLHATIPVTASLSAPALESDEEEELFPMSSPSEKQTKASINSITPGKVTPNVWTVMHKWIFALSTKTDAEIKRKEVLKKELNRLVEELGDNRGLGKNGVSAASSVTSAGI